MSQYYCFSFLQFLALETSNCSYKNVAVFYAYSQLHHFNGPFQVNGDQPSVRQFSFFCCRQRYGYRLVRMGWQSIWIVGVSACVIFILHQKMQKMANKNMSFGYHPVGTPHAYANRRWGNPAGMQRNPLPYAGLF